MKSVTEVADAAENAAMALGALSRTLAYEQQRMDVPPVFQAAEAALERLLSVGAANDMSRVAKHAEAQMHLVQRAKAATTAHAPLEIRLLGQDAAELFQKASAAGYGKMFLEMGIEWNRWALAVDP